MGKWEEKEAQTCWRRRPPASSPRRSLRGNSTSTAASSSPGRRRWLPMRRRTRCFRAAWSLSVRMPLRPLLRRRRSRKNPRSPNEGNSHCPTKGTPRLLTPPATRTSTSSRPPSAIPRCSPGTSEPGPGFSPSKAWSRPPVLSPSTISSTSSPSRNASTAGAVWKAGRWSFPGSVSP